MSEEAEIEYTIDQYKSLIERYRKSTCESNELYIKQKLLVQKLWTKIAELIENPEDMADFISEVYD